MKILFAGTPDFAAAPLLALIQHHEVVAVFTQPDRKSGRGKKLTPPPIKTIARQHDIPVHQPNSLKDQVEMIISYQPDIIVVVAYGMLLPQTILDIPKIACINIHASILPRWRGAAPIQRAIEAGDQQTGVSIMQMEKGLDTGSVYQMLVTPITEQDTSSSLHDKLSELGSKGIIETLQELEKNPDLQPTTQDDEGVTYAEKISKSEADIDWSLSAEQIERKIRAFIPWPICQSYHQSSRLRIWEAKVAESDLQCKAGEITNITEEAIEVACGGSLGDKCLSITKLQKEGGKPLSSAEFINGYQMQVGEHFSNNKS